MRDHGLVSVLAALIVLSLATPAGGYTLIERTTTFNVQAGIHIQGRHHLLGRGAFHPATGYL